MNVIHCFKGRKMRTERLPSSVSCPVYAHYHLVCLESELLYFNFRIEGNYLSYLSFHCMITQPDCSRVLVHLGSDLVVILPLTQAKECETRNLIVSAHGKRKQWGKTTSTVHKLFFICKTTTRDI